MKVLNINIHFYPQSYGGATIVAEKLSHGLLDNGHDVYNVTLRPNHASDKDFDIINSPFGPTIGINNINLSPSNRFYNPSVSSLLFELYDVISPDKIFVHAVQHMGILTFLEQDQIRSKTTIIAHDYYWACLQGFRALPNGKLCTRKINETECKDCAFYPGMTNLIYQHMIDLTTSCEMVVFPSSHIHAGYERIYGAQIKNGHTIQNPDASEILCTRLKKPFIRNSDEIRLGYFGGPGYSKGWDVVRRLSSKLQYINNRSLKYILFDAGQLVGTPWYSANDITKNMEVAPPFHWSRAGEEMEKLDVVLMPSRVQESYGLAAREALSLGKKSIIYPNGALSELIDFKGVHPTNDDDVISDTINAISTSNDSRMEYSSMSSVDYAKYLMREI